MLKSGEEAPRMACLKARQRPVGGAVDDGFGRNRIIVITSTKGLTHPHESRTGLKHMEFLKRLIETLELVRKRCIITGSSPNRRWQSTAGLKAHHRASFTGVEGKLKETIEDSEEHPCSRYMPDGALLCGELLPWKHSHWVEGGLAIGSRREVGGNHERRRCMPRRPFPLRRGITRI